MKRAVLLALALLAPASARGGGLFMLEEHGARASGRAGAVVATSSDGAAISFNPAGLGFSRGWAVELGASVVAPSAELYTPSGGHFVADDEVLLLPNLYAHGRPFDFLAVGIGVSAPFVNEWRWPAATPGLAVARRQALRTTFFTGAAAFNANRWIEGLAIGAGIDLVPATTGLDRDVELGDNRGAADLEATAIGVGGRAGVVYRPPFVPGLRAGLSWRSEIDLGFAGLADYDVAAPYRTLLPPDGPVSMHRLLPQSLLFGAAYRFGPLEAEVDVAYTNWRRLRHEELVLPDGTLQQRDRGLSDTMSLRLGGEINFAQIDLDLRAGYAFDASPVPPRALDLSQPDTDRHTLAAGATYYLPLGMFIEAGLSYVLPSDKDTHARGPKPAVKGTYRASAVVASFSLGARLDGDPRPEIDYPLESAVIMQPTQP